MAANFSNTGYMGIPLLITAFGDAGKLPAVISTVLNGAIVMPFYIAVVEYTRSDAAHRAQVFADAGLGVVKSPLVISAALGILWSALGLPVPVFLAQFCDILGSAAPPAALFAMGLFMVGKSFRGDRAEIALLTGMKLLVHPLLAFGMLLLIPLEKAWSDSLLVLAALPTGSLVFVLSNLYGVYTQRSTGVIIASTFASVVTLSLLFNLLGMR
jgi:predicted permease